jgi:cupin fold WbuC family metalloprotein
LLIWNGIEGDNEIMKSRVKVIGRDELTKLSETAKTLPRLRKNFNVHTELNEPVQRLYNAMEPNTYVRPHRHQGESRWEFFLIVFGRAMVLTFDDAGAVLEKIELSATGPNHAIEIPGDTWHTLVSLEAGTVLFEIKQGPYRAMTDKDFATWAPQEGGSSSRALVGWFIDAKAGDIWAG